MQNILSNRRLLTFFSVAALLAGLLVAQLSSLHGLAASPKALPILTVCDSANVAVPFALVPPGLGVPFTATSTGCTTPEYKFLFLAPGSSTWVVKREYGSSVFTWFTAGAKEGVWQIGVWARETGSESRYQAWAISTVTLLVPDCVAPSIVASPAGPAVAGAGVTLFAESTSCAAPHFEFWEMAPGTNTWVLLQDYNGGALNDRIHLDTTGLRPGAYRFAVWARDQFSTRKYEGYAMLTYWING